MIEINKVRPYFKWLIKRIVFNMEVFFKRILKGCFSNSKLYEQKKDPIL
jgi:hypothetical protein